MTDRSHIADFALHLIQKHGPMPVRSIYAAFVNVGNDVDGDGVAGRIAYFGEMIGADDRLALAKSGDSMVSLAPPKAEAEVAAVEMTDNNALQTQPDSEEKIENELNAGTIDCEQAAEQEAQEPASSESGDAKPTAEPSEPETF
jgi:hypothetical protein